MKDHDQAPTSRRAATAARLVLLTGILSASARAETYIGATPFGNPSAVVVNQNTNRIYVANSLSRTVTVIDGSTNAVLTTIALPGYSAPDSIAVNPNTNRIYTASYYGGLIVIDGATNAIVANKSWTDQGTTTGIAVNPTTNRVYLLIPDTDPFNSDTERVIISRVAVIDGADNARLAHVDLPPGCQPWAIAVNASTNRVYTGNHINPDNRNNNGAISVIDGAANTLLTTVPIFGRPHDLAVNPGADRVYAATVLGASAAEITVLDGTTNAVLTRIDTPYGTAIYPSVSVNASTDRIYLSSTDGNGVVVINGSTNSIVTTISAPVGGGSGGCLAVNTGTDRLYTANGRVNSVSVIDTATHVLTATIHGVAPGPTGAAVNSSTNRVYTSGFNGMSIIDGDTDTVLDRITLSYGDLTYGVAVNSSTNRVYLANFKRILTDDPGVGSVSVIDGDTNAVLTTVTLPGVSAPVSIAANPVTNRIYTADVDSTVSTDIKSAVTVIDGASNTVLTTIALPATLPHYDPVRIAVNSVTNRIYVTTYFSTIVIDGATNSILTSIPNVGFAVLATNENTNRIYTDGEGSIGVIDGATNAVVNSIAISIVPMSATVNPVTGRIYVTDRFGSMVVIDGGTDAILSTERYPYHVNLWDPGTVAVNPSSGRVYVASYALSTVFSFQGPVSTPVLGDVTRALRIASGLAAALSADFGRLDVATSDGSSGVDGRISLPDALKLASLLNES